MRILNPSVDIDQFFYRLKKASQSLLILDYDGTLAPFKIDPKEAIPYKGVEERLEKIILAGTTLVIVSGRALSDLMPLLIINPLPELWGSHGAERLAAGKVYVVSDIMDLALQGLSIAKDRIASYPIPLKYENKPFSVAVHWRSLSEEEIKNTKEKISKDWSDLLEKYRLEILPFDGGLELRPLGINKGKAVETLLADATGDAAIAYLGDDLTDEEAFAALGERGLKVLVRQEFRPTKADIQLIPPNELIEFLDLWALEVEDHE